MAHESVEATGAKPGDYVKCVARRDPPGLHDTAPFEVGATYPVVMHAGRPAVRSIYFGLGWSWEKVEG